MSTKKMKYFAGEVDSSMPWPDEGHLTCSGHNRTTFFVEYHSDSHYIRGDSDVSLGDAERVAYQKLLKYDACPEHEWETRGYTNGAGFCKNCDKFGSGVFTLEEVGSICEVCAKPTNWTNSYGKLDGTVVGVKVCERHSKSYNAALAEVFGEIVASGKATRQQESAHRSILSSIRMFEILDEDEVDNGND